VDDVLFLLVFLAGIAVTVVVGFFILRAFREARRKVPSPTAQRQPGTVPLPEDHHHGPELDYLSHYTPAVVGRGARPAELTVTFEVALPGDFTIRRITGFDRWGKRVGLAVPVRTGDSAFDDTFYIQTDSPEFCRSYFGDPTRRQAVRQLFDQGFTDLDSDDGKLVATWRGYPSSSVESPGDSRKAAETMVPLTHRIPPRPTITARSRPLSRKRLQVLSAFGFFGGMILLGFVWVAMSGNSFPLAHWTFIAYTLPFSLLVFLVFLVWGYWFVRGHSTSHLQLRSLFLTGVFLLPLAGVLVGEGLNAWLDTSPPEEHVQTISDKTQSRRRSSSSYYAEVPHWSEAGRTLSLNVGFTNYNRIIPGRDRMRIITHAGWLGFEWIESFEFQKPQEG
jgi:hypothetical protein